MTSATARDVKLQLKVNKRREIYATVTLISSEAIEVRERRTFMTRIKS